MAAVQSAPVVFALPAAAALHHPHPHPHHPLPPGAAALAAAAAAPAAPQHDDSDAEEEDGDENVNDIPWWLQGHAPAPQPHQRGRHARGLAGHSRGQGRGGHHHEGGPGGPFAFLFRQLVVHPVQALARGLGAKTKGGGHHNHHHHHHGPMPPPAAPTAPATAPAPEPTKAEADVEEEVEEAPQDEEEAEPAPVLLVGVPRVYSCGDCRMHLASDMDVVSRAFQGRGGRAFLLDKCVNVVTGPPEDRLLMTGVHTVADLCCGGCRALLGWKYEKAHEPSQRYKEGKYILERVHLYQEEEDGEGGAHNEGWFTM